MDPITWAVIAGLNVAMASQKASQQARQRKMEADIRAAEIEASPWTGRAPSTQVSTGAPNVWAEMAGAGINTLAQGAALKQSGLFTGAEQAAEEAARTTASSAAQSPTLMPSYNMANASYMPATTKQALEESSSYFNPFQSKRSSWLSAYGK